MGLLQRGDLRVVGLLVWHLASSRVSIPRDPSQSYIAFSDQNWESYSITFTILYWLKHSFICADSHGGDIDSTF